MFSYQSTHWRRVSVWTAAVVIALWTTVFSLGINLSIINAAQLANRSIVMESSAVGFVDGQYQVTFNINRLAGFTAGLVIDFCSNSPIIGEACTAPTDMNIDAGNLTIDVVSGFVHDDLVNNADHSTATTLFLDSTIGNNPGNSTVHLHLGSGGGAADGITNGSVAGAFYARIVTYFGSGDNDGYSDTAPGTYQDDGGIALALTNPLNITARVQEILRFCVGDTDAHSAHDCTDISGSTINIGVLDPTNSSVSKSSVNGVAGDKNGYAMISTNAVGGATVSYIGKTLESGGNHIDAVGTTRAELVADAEKFGMDATLDQTKGGTSNMTRDAEFNEASHYTFAGSQYTADTIASASTVVSKETLIFDFAADASMVTPTGIYTTAVTYIGTGLF